MQKRRRLLRRHRVDVKAGSPLEAPATRPRQPRDDLDMPVIMRQRLRVEGSGVDDVVIGRFIEGRFQFQQDRFEDRAELIDLDFLDVFEMAVVVLR